MVVKTIEEYNKENGEQLETLNCFVCGKPMIIWSFSYCFSGFETMEGDYDICYKCARKGGEEGRQDAKEMWRDHNGTVRKQKKLWEELKQAHEA